MNKTIVALGWSHRSVAIVDSLSGEKKPELLESFVEHRSLWPDYTVDEEVSSSKLNPYLARCANVYRGQNGVVGFDLDAEKRERLYKAAIKRIQGDLGSCMAQSLRMTVERSQIQQYLQEFGARIGIYNVYFVSLP